MTAAIILLNCRYLGRALDTMKAGGIPTDEKLIPQLSPLALDHINLTGDYVWSNDFAVDADGYMPLQKAEGWLAGVATV